MKIFLISTLFIILGLSTASANTDNIGAITLQKNCQELDKAVLGNTFDQSKVESCTGYLDGFFDSLVITNRLAGQQFCLPNGIPRIKHTEILDAWINKNKNIAETTTAAVALFAALKIAFPCPRR